MSPNEFTPVTAHVAPETKQALELLADREQRSVSFIIRELVENRIREFEKEVTRAG
jgi:predicted DNA-binding protein